MFSHFTEITSQNNKGNTINNSVFILLPQTIETEEYKWTMKKMEKWKEWNKATLSPKAEEI